MNPEHKDENEEPTIRMEWRSFPPITEKIE